MTGTEKTLEKALESSGELAFAYDFGFRAYILITGLLSFQT